jgi:pyruvate dehydrogenase E1 component alpha subunit
VYEATQKARQHAVSGQGPVFLNIRTYRLVGHYIGDPQVYREKRELEELRETKDPIELLRARLGIGDEDFDALDTEIEAIVEGAVEFAKAGTDPKPEDALKYVYA